MIYKKNVIYVLLNKKMLAFKMTFNQIDSQKNILNKI